ncbi:hypothetical protein T4A_7891 [Trichinella pseudospiralis]|uniref:Uncharacterized protein n=1 Tax=Trichinella pseudospiralis TaxID=6337 RepID=A0A0V1DZS1_TRIPS|nr:hypothetical protein T4A_7891 [Trichinella pseudospiralis]
MSLNVCGLESKKAVKLRKIEARNAVASSRPCHCSPSYRLRFQGKSIVLLSGYHSLPHVWSVQPDMGVPPVYNTMSGNPFVKLKNYIHFAVNQELTKALIRPWCYTSVAIMQKCLSGESLFALVIRSGCSTKMTATPTTLAYIKERINGLQWNPWEPGLATASMLSDTALFKMTRESFDYRKDGMVYVAKWTKERATTSQFVKVLIDGKAVYEEELCETGNEKGQNAAIFLTLQQDQIITDCESKNYCESSQKVQNLSFCILSPLKSKRAEVVASKLLEIFVTLLSQHSAIRQRSRIFKCHNFRTQNMLAELKLVTCTPRVDVRVHETTGQSPSKVTRTLDGRGEEPPIGLESYVLPKLLDDAAKTEEEIEEFLTSKEETNDEESLNTHEKNMEKTKAQSEKEQLQGQSRAAVSITTLRGLDVDRGPADLKNFLVVIMAKYEGLYTAGCKEGRLSSKFTASDLQNISRLDNSAEGQQEPAEL